MQLFGMHDRILVDVKKLYFIYEKGVCKILYFYGLACGKREALISAPHGQAPFDGIREHHHNFAPSG